MESSESFRLRALMRQHLESLVAAGVEQLPQPTQIVVKSSVRTAESHLAAGHLRDLPTPNAQGGAKTVASQDGGPAKLENAANLTVPLETGEVARDLEILRKHVAECTLCGELAGARTQTVFGVGNRDARLCFLGEAPGADEDRLGEPFVGRAGELLNKILAACELKRSDVYILNVLKCRPPGNRTPSPDEARNCRPFLDRQLALIRPEFICCLGAVAAQNLLGVTTPIGKLRGVEHAYGEVRVFCTYHPAYLLRNPSAKKYAWDDMKMLMQAMGTPVK